MRTYVIINSDDVEDVDFNQVLETSTDTLRWNKDLTKTFVKFEGETPSFLAGKKQYTHGEILALLAGPEWTPESPT